MVVSVPEIGHLQPILNIAKQLTHRGHAVTLVTCKFLVPRVQSLCDKHHIELVGVASKVRSPDEGRGDAYKLKSSKKTLNLYVYYSEMMRAGFRRTVQRRLPHAIIADFMTLCAFPIGTEFGIPVAVNFSDTIFIDVAGASPSPWHPYWMLFRAPFVLKKWKYFLNSAVFQVSSMVCESLYSRVMFVNSFWGFHEAALMPPNVYFTGPMEERSSQIQTETSDAAFNAWLENMRALGLPVVYATFGTMVELNQQQVRSLYLGLAAVKCVAVAWSLKQAQQRLLPVDRDQLPHNFYIYHWFPQQEVLSLKDVAVVVSHCGFGGLTQVISHGKPLVAMPFSGDQPANAAAAKKRGMAEVLDKDKLTPDIVESTVRQVLGCERYKVKAGDLCAALHSSGGSWECALRAEHLATHGCEYVTRKSPNLITYTLQTAGMLTAAVGAVCCLQYLYSCRPRVLR